MRTALAIAVSLWAWQALAVECVTVKYRDTTVCLDHFVCTDTPQSSFVRRVCYDASNGLHADQSEGRLVPLLCDRSDDGERPSVGYVRGQLLRPQHPSRPVRLPATRGAGLPVRTAGQTRDRRAVRLSRNQFLDPTSKPQEVLDFAQFAEFRPSALILDW